jgi:hypothetical protein
MMANTYKHTKQGNLESLLRKIEDCPQWVEETEDELPRYIALATAETYRLGTRLYCLARLSRYGVPSIVLKLI